MAWLLHERRILLPGSAVKVQERTRGPGGRGVSGGEDAAGAPRREVGVVRVAGGRLPSVEAGGHRWLLRSGLCWQLPHSQPWGMEGNEGPLHWPCRL